MSTKRIVIGLGLASGAALAAWLLTGSRRKKTTAFIADKVTGIKDSLKKSTPKQSSGDDSDALYV